jgi:hypothetical protein
MLKHSCFKFTALQESMAAIFGYSPIHTVSGWDLLSFDDAFNAIAAHGFAADVEYFAGLSHLEESGHYASP